mmetsp:Transcript_29930/g.80044  ORF Transcript_29930/g.80044 Transcript_29930/m.80044 type:complete len:868 (+) Transcript_29930:124-2727(+)
MSGLTELLLATQDPDHNKRAGAEAQIKQAEQASVEQYFVELAKELANNQKPVIARQLSGLLLKNGLAAKDPARDRDLKNRWKQLSAQSRNLVKEATTSALITPELDVGKASAQVLAKIGGIEIPVNEWDGLVPLLLTHVTNQDPRARQIALITLGYLCEELVAISEIDGIKISDDISNHVLTAVVQGMRDGDAQTKLEATRAFYHAVVLAQTNFRKPNERDFIMEVVIDACKFKAAEPVQIAAFECLVQIATEYYDFLLPYMNSLGPLTWETIKTAPEKVSIPAMEFWSTVCDEELDLLDLQASGRPLQRPLLKVIDQAVASLVPILTETLCRQGSEEDDDTWNLAMAAGTCLGLVAQVVGDKCVDIVLNFVSANFQQQDWKHREAAILAYGSIMEGPSSEKMRPTVEQIYPHLVQSMRDPVPRVRDTVAWTLGRIAMFHPAIVPVKQLVPILCEALRDVPRVAANVCWVTQVLAEAQEWPSPAQPPHTTALSEFFPSAAEALVGCVSRPDAEERQLRMTAYNALSVLVSRAGLDCAGHMQTLTQVMLTHLSASFALPEQVSRECELQGYICGVLTALVQRLREATLPVADRIMEEALKVICAYKAVKGGAPVLQEEALLLVAALANAVGAGFERFMPHFAPHLQVGLANYEDQQVCFMAVGVVGDLCRALEGKMAAYCDTILETLYGNIVNGAVDRKIKAAIMSCFGDIALAIAGDFEKYLQPVVRMLQQAASTKITDSPDMSEEWVDYLNSLREGVLDAYTGIIHGLKESNKLHLFKEHVNGVLLFVKDICEDNSGTVSESVMKAAVGCVGDCLFSFQQELAVYVAGAPFLMRLVEYSSGCSDPGIRNTASWLQGLLQRFGGGAQ